MYDGVQWTKSKYETAQSDRAKSFKFLMYVLHILYIYRHMMLCYDIIIIIIGVVNIVSDCGCHHISLDKPKNELKTESKRHTTSPQNMDS